MSPAGLVTDPYRLILNKKNFFGFLFKFCRLHNYWKCGRNLLHPKGYEYRFSSLKRGKLVVVALISDLPATKHDPQSFAVDLTFYSVSFFSIISFLTNLIY